MDSIPFTDQSSVRRLHKTTYVIVLSPHTILGRCYISTWSPAPMFKKRLFSFLASSQCQAEMRWWSEVNIMTCIRFIYRKRVYPTAWQSENTLNRKRIFFHPTIQHISARSMRFLRYKDTAYSFDEVIGKRTSTALTFQLLYAFTSVGNEGFRIQGHSSCRSRSMPAAKYGIHWQLTHSRKCKRWRKYCTRHRTTHRAHASTRLLVSRDNVFHPTVRWVLYSAL